MEVTTDKGICRLSVIPVRALPTDLSEITTQLLFGEHFEIVSKSEDGNWYEIRNHFDGYQGWIDEKQSTPISNAHYEDIADHDFKITYDIVSTLNFQGRRIRLLPGSILPFFSNELFESDIEKAFEGKSKALGEKSDYNFVESLAFQFLDAPYMWGGKTPFGIDCSGFIQQIFRISGYQLKRDASQQAFQGRKMISYENAKKGDLAFFSKGGSKADHVGLILPGGKIIHASGKVRVDILDNKGIFNEERQKYTHKLFTIKRIL